MKTIEEIEQLAEKWFLINQYNQYDNIHSHRIPECITTKNLFIKGYTQCQEDVVDKKYDEEHMLLAYVTGRANTDEDDKEVGKMRENFNRLLALIETRLNKK